MTEEVVQTEEVTPLYKTKRGTAILQEWPIDKQLEALTEAAMGDDTKMQELCAFILQVKAEIPKPTDGGL